MKNTFKDAIIIIIGVILLSAGVAYAGTWTAPPTTPTPAGFPYNNVAAPINVGGSLTDTSGDQVKIGSIWSQKSLGTDGGGSFGTLQIRGGSPVAGQVLTAIDSTGLAAWRTSTGGGGSCGFGDWQDLTSVGSLGQVQGPAATDGFVTAHAYDGHLNGYTDSSPSPTVRRLRFQLYHSASASTITMPVKKGDYWKLVTTGGDGRIDAIYWIPMGC